MEPLPPLNCKLRIALLIDGENLPPTVAGQIIVKASQFGDLTIRRVYGNAATLGAWNNVPGIRTIHSGTGKNATDLLLAVEAMSFVLSGQVDALAIASSDRDFVHLVTHLREKSFRVIGLGEAKAPENFRKSCSTFVELKIAAPAAASVVPKNVETLDAKIMDIVRAEGDANGYQIARLGGRLHAVHKVKISEEREKNWRAYLLARPSLYDCDARGPDARVRVKN